MSTPPQAPGRSSRRLPPASPRPPTFHYRVAAWVGIGFVLALVVAIGMVLARGSGETATRSATSGEVIAPEGLTSDGWIAVGDGPVTVSVYFDYLCPACGAFEAANGGELERMIDAGEITVELRPIAFLDRLSAGSEYSTRSANALATVADADPASLWAFHRALYADQPAEGSDGHTDEQLAAIAHDAGVPDEVTARFAEDKYTAWTAERTERAFADGVEGTPTILIDNRVFPGDPYVVGPLTAAIEQARR